MALSVAASNNALSNTDSVFMCAKDLLIKFSKRAIILRAFPLVLIIMSSSFGAQAPTNFTFESRNPPEPQLPTLRQTPPLEDKSNEDKRAACGMVVALSGAVMTAALAVLAGQVTFAAFSFDKGKYQALTTIRRRIFLILNLGSVMFLVGSIIAGGRGIAILYKAGFTGLWELASSGNNFETQTDLCLLGLVSVIMLVAVGVSQRSGNSEPQLLPHHHERLDDLDRRLCCLESKLKSLDHFENELKSAHSKIQALLKRKRS